MGLQAWPRLLGSTLIFGGKTLSFDTVIIAQSRYSFPGGYRKKIGFVRDQINSLGEPVRDQKHPNDRDSPLTLREEIS